MIHDLRTAVRSLLANRRFALVTILTLAFGIGAQQLVSGRLRRRNLRKAGVIKALASNSRRQCLRQLSQPDHQRQPWMAGTRGAGLGATKIDGAKPTRTPLRRGSKPHEQPRINQN
jgi:hypothetical protein